MSANIFKRRNGVNGHGRPRVELRKLLKDAFEQIDSMTPLPRFLRIGGKILNLNYIRSLDFTDDYRVDVEWSNGALIHIEGAETREELLELFASSKGVLIIPAVCAGGIGCRVTEPTRSATPRPSRAAAGKRKRRRRQA